MMHATTETDPATVSSADADEESSAASPPNSDDAIEEGADGPTPGPSATTRTPILAGIAILATLTALVAWLGWQAYQSHEDQQRRALFLEVGRQSAINLTTIDWADADTDVQRILGTATGHFHDEFSQDSQDFIDTVKQTRAKSTGTVSDSGIETATNHDAQILVAVKVVTSNAGAPEQAPRYWRMRLAVQDVDGDVKVSNVEFVP